MHAFMEYFQYKNKLFVLMFSSRLFIFQLILAEYIWDSISNSMNLLFPFLNVFEWGINWKSTFYIIHHNAVIWPPTVAWVEWQEDSLKSWLMMLWGQYLNYLAIKSQMEPGMEVFCKDLILIHFLTSTSIPMF